jgi:hypothetical protein
MHVTEGWESRGVLGRETVAKHGPVTLGRWQVSTRSLSIRQVNDVAVLTRMRIWLPDAPGVLGAVAAEIGGVKGNVVGLEVLEREAGVAIDEFVVELPDDSDAVDATCRAVRNVPGAGVEEVIVMSGEQTPDREGAVLAATADILGTATPVEARDALCSSLRSVFGLAWLAVADERLEGFVEVQGDAPTARWIAAFAEGARSGADPAHDTLRSGVFVDALPGTGLVVCGGRAAAIRRRERNEISVLVTVTARFIRALGGTLGSGPGQSRT